MRHWNWAFIAAAALAVPVLAQQNNAAPPPALGPVPAAAVPAKAKPIVQIAILLDTSNSMDGLIEQAKIELWRIVNELAKGQPDWPHPDIQVALYQYGTPALGRDNNFIKQLVPLTDDLDKVSAELTKLKTNGGDEFCGAVIQQAAKELKWVDDPGAFKAIFIAGNEPFTQGGVDYHVACKEAISKGIIVNTIFCGDERSGEAAAWRDGAKLADGKFASIDQNQRVARMATPQDQKLADLGAKINSTYVPYGAQGTDGAKNQAAQDTAAVQAGSVAGSPAAIAAERAITKGNTIYRNATWDLVDAVKEKRVNLKDIKTEDLPEEMRPLDAQGREDYIAKKIKEREEIQAQIKKLSDERDQYLAANAPPPGTGAAGARGGAGGRGGGGGGGGGGFGGAVIGGGRQGR